MSKAVFLLAPIFLSGCLQKSPGDQCLESFRMSLKDPDSGKVISFVEPKLTYTATNSYGARTQGHALCVKKENKWMRDRASEQLAALELSTERLKKSTACIAREGSAKNCSAGSDELKRSHALGKEPDLSALEEEASRDLGFQ